jgi:hypothetical protein
LTLALGGMTHAELMERMSSREISEWMAFAQVEPFGPDAYYLGHAIVASTVANRNRAKNEKTHKVSEFMPQFDRHAQGPEEMINIAATMTMAMGGKVDMHEPDQEDEDDG